LTANIWTHLQPKVQPRHAIRKRFNCSSHGDGGGDRDASNLRGETTLNVLWVNAVKRFASWEECGNYRRVLTRCKELRNTPAELR
jgi:hypothetical protein